MSTSRSRQGAPPKPELVLRIGVTGHRPNRLPASSLPRIKRQIDEIVALLESIATEAAEAHADVYFCERQGPPRLRAISALAEGADTLVAEIALQRGAELAAALPFAAEEYERDFAAGAPRDGFHALLRAAFAVFELDGSREREAESYEAVGRLVVRQCDVLLAIWDGEPAAGRGGTALIAAYAGRLGVPVVWIHATKEREPTLMTADEAQKVSEAPLAALNGLLSASLSPPARKPPTPALRRFLGLAEESGGNLLDDYYAERNPSFSWGGIYLFVRNLLLGRLRLPNLRVEDFARDTAARWQHDFAQAGAALKVLEAPPLLRLREHYAWASGLADLYGGLYRSAFTMNYLLAALAVLLAVLGMVVPAPGRLWTFLEMASLLAIVVITVRGKSRRWHERWLAYRNLAERLRAFRFLLPLGEVPRLAPPPERKGTDSSRMAWVDWLTRAIIREIPLPKARLDGAYLAAAGRFIADVEVAGQIEYHATNAERMRHLDHRLHLAGVALFLVRIAAVAAHLMLDLGAGEAAGESAGAADLGAWLGLLSAALPAFGAAFYGLRSQGEFASLVERSAAMTIALTRLREQLLAQAQAGGERRNVAAAAAEIADVMLVETADWHQVFGAKPLDLPA